LRKISDDCGRSVTTAVKTLNGGVLPPKAARASHEGEHGMTDLYPIMKGKAYRLAKTIIAPKSQDEDDLLKTIMSDSDHTRQATFLTMLPTVIPAVAHRQILLDGLAREYAGVTDWMAYVERETSE
jgi:hypothetical protein